jgi:hypothetical protein
MRRLQPTGGCRTNTKKSMQELLVGDMTFGLHRLCCSACGSGLEISSDVVQALSLPISRPTDATCYRFLFYICMCITLHVSSVKLSSSGVPHSTYSLQFLCLCLSLALSCKKPAVSYKTVPQTDTNTETGGLCTVRDS